MGDSHVRGHGDHSVVKPPPVGDVGNGRVRVAAMILAEWRFVSLAMSLAVGLAFAFIRYDQLIATQDMIADQVEQQSVTDSTAAGERWTLAVGLTFQACWAKADTLGEPREKQSVRRGCVDILNFAPRLQRGELPTPPNPRVWRLERTDRNPFYPRR
jgi:hypothetical protein